VNLRRGLVRLAISVATIWFVFWTSAYVIKPYSSLEPEISFATRIDASSVVVPCVVAALVLGGWIVMGLRSK
jgi:hypothetical protein